MITVRKPGVCARCDKHRIVYCRGVCQMCYKATLSGSRRKLSGREHEQDYGDYMPETAYAVVRVIRSPISGKLRVMIGWYRKPAEAKHIAERCCRHFSCRVERWIAVGYGKPMASRPRRLRKKRGSLHYETVAVYPRRSGKRVAA